jgi:hypothetical protein
MDKVAKDRFPLPGTNGVELLGAIVTGDSAVSGLKLVPWPFVRIMLERLERKSVPSSLVVRASAPTSTLLVLPLRVSLDRTP